MKINGLLGNKRNGESAADLLSNSRRAVCGITEREVAVLPKDVENAKAKLRRAGYRVIGVGEQEGRRKKVWFIERGGFGSL